MATPALSLYKYPDFLPSFFQVIVAPDSLGPNTSNFLAGELVPIPTFPAALIRIRSELLVLNVNG